MRKKTSNSKKDGNGSLIVGIAALFGIGYLLLSKEEEPVIIPAVAGPQLDTYTNNPNTSNASLPSTGIYTAPATTQPTTVIPVTANGQLSRQQALGIILAAKSGRTAAQFTSFDTAYLVAWAKGIAYGYQTKTLTPFTYLGKKYSITTGTAI